MVSRWGRWVVVSQGLCTIRTPAPASGTFTVGGQGACAIAVAGRVGAAEITGTEPVQGVWRLAELVATGT